MNDKLLQGPDLTNSLVGVLARFRQETVTVLGDIEAMFHQVKVAPEDCNALRFLWWPNGDVTALTSRRADDGSTSIWRSFISELRQLCVD